jgi:hypothetical protein
MQWSFMHAYTCGNAKLKIEILKVTSTILNFKALFRYFCMYNEVVSILSKNTSYDGLFQANQKGRV